MRLDTEELYRRYADDLVRFAATIVGSAEAEDVVARVFSRAMRNDAFLKADNQRSYVYRSVANESKSYIRSRGRRHRRETKAYVERSKSIAWQSPDTDLSVALDALSVQQRAVVHLTYWEDLSGKEVATRLGISEGSVRKHLARAKEKLRELIP